jgi:hypothetical protein
VNGSDSLAQKVIRDDEVIDEMNREVGRRVLPIQEVRKRLAKAQGAPATADREVYAV